MTSQSCDQINNQVAHVTSQIYSLQMCENERLVRELHTIEQKIQHVQQHLDAVSRRSHGHFDRKTNSFKLGLCTARSKQRI